MSLQGSVLTYTNDSLTYWLPDRIETIKLGFGKLFYDKVCQVPLKMHIKYTRFYRFLLFTPVSIENSKFRTISMTFNHIKTNSAKLAHYRFKIRKVLSFSYFQSLMQHRLYSDKLQKRLNICPYWFYPCRRNTEK